MFQARILSGAFNAILPRRCVFCGIEVGAKGATICAPCHRDLPWRAASHAPLPRPFENLIAPLEYAFPVDAAIKAFKFKRRLFYAPAFTTILSEAACDLADDIDAVAAVPLHWRRKMQRGFNQADELARPLARILGKPMVKGLHRRVATQYQSGLSMRRREKNVASVFVVKTKMVSRHLLLVDDVVTTGATVRSLAKVLRRAGAEKISVLTLAQTGDVTR